MPRRNVTPLAPREVRVYYASSATVADPERRARCLELLSDDERARQQRFHFERDRESYLAAHALTRSLLAELLAIEPRALAFTAGPQGRPELSFPDRSPRLRFNLSHTHGFVACVVALEHDVGVDVEHCDRKLELERLAHTVFSDSERAALFALPETERRRRFFELWTLKEAYIKAVGKGLSLPLRSISVELTPGVRPRMSFSAPLSGDGAAIFLDVRQLAPAFTLAVAVGATVDTLHVEERLPGDE